MKYDFVVLGAGGIQGRIVSKDLLESGYSVLLCDLDSSKVNKFLEDYKKTAFEHVDLRDAVHAKEIISRSGSDMVINCAEGDWNLNALKACIEAGANSLDLGSDIEMTQQQLEMHELLKSRGLIHITGCGSVPGIGNVMLRHAAADFDSIDTVEVGFAWNSNIKKFVVPFSIESIIEEFTDPAPVLEEGEIIYKKPLESVVDINHPKIGKQKRLFVSRHPEIFTFHHYYKNMGLKNIRFYAGFPKHSFDAIVSFIEFGLGGKLPVRVNGSRIKPLELLTAVMKDLQYPEGYKEKESLWLKIYGKKDNEEKETSMECFAATIRGWEDAGCNIDTGMPTSITAQMIKNGTIKEKGSFAPEAVVPPEPFFKELMAKKIRVYKNGNKIN